MAFVWSKFTIIEKLWFFYAMTYFTPIILRTIFKILLYSLLKDEINYFKYKNRLSGMMSSIKGKKSYKRPKF